MRFSFAGCVVFALTILLGWTRSSMAATFTVDATTDAITLSGCTAAVNDCTLRGAIALANITAGSDTIAFDIPPGDAGCNVGGVCRITLTTSLPDISQDLTIDGYTQAGAQPNTIAADAGGLDSVLKIEINRVNTLVDAALRACGPNTNHSLTIRGLAIAGGFQSGIDYYDSCSSTQNGVLRVEGNYLGTDADGNALTPLNITGIRVGSPFGSTTGAFIGGTSPAQRNLISNNGVGINLLGFGHQVLGNLIGTDRSGITALGNSGNGVYCAGGVLAHFCLIGDGTPQGRNIISGNGVSGVQIDASGPARIRGNVIGANVSGAPLGNIGDGVRIQGDNRATALPALVGGPNGDANEIAFNQRGGILAGFHRQHIAQNNFHDNQHFAIWLGTAFLGNPLRLINDPGDADATNIGNRGQNFPEIRAFSTGSGTVDLTYRVDSDTVNASYPLNVRFFKAHGDEGRVYLGTDSYPAASAQIDRTIQMTLGPGISANDGDVIIATATDAEGNTSEFSFHTVSLGIEAPLPSSCTALDSVFCDGFESASTGASLLARVSATASGGPFKPNGVVTVGDNRGGSCSAQLSPTTTPLTSSGQCLLMGSGGPGLIQINATLDAHQSAFASPSGTDATASASFSL